MKTTNLPEEQLASWKLRQPARRVKRRAFQADVNLPSSTWFWGALAPAAVCVLLTFMNVSSSPTFHLQRSIMAVALSNQSDMAYASGGGEITQNHWGSVTFDWTNRSVFTSSIPFTQPTNFSN